MKDASLPLVEMEIFRAGDYGPKGTYTPETLEQIATDYQPDMLEAPLTFDHSQSGPAYGWVAGLRRQGDKLLALLRDVPDSVRQMVKSGAYRRRSVEIVREFPETGRPYLRAVSLLGAASPHVHGLADVKFSVNEPADSPATESAAPSDAEPPATTASTSQAADTPPSNDDPAIHYQAEIDRLRTEIRQRDAAAIVQQFRARGCHVSPCDVAGIESILAAVDGQSLSYEDEQHQLATWFTQFVGQMTAAPTIPQLPEATVDCFRHDEQTAADNFDCAAASPESAALHRRALAIQAQRPTLPYAEALVQASRLQ